LRALLAIVKQTIRSSVRSKVFHVLFALILLAVVLLPITVAGDGTARGQLQISLTYSLGVVAALVSTAALWLGCALLSREIESYNLHLVMTKPSPPWLVWLGKWLGVFLMHAVVFVIAALIILALVTVRINRSGFSDEELRRVHNEVLVGRRAHMPRMPNFNELTKQEYRRRLAEGLLEPNHNREMVVSEILRQVKAQSTEVPAEHTRFFLYGNVRVPESAEAIFLRYRYYIGGTTRSQQKVTRCLWGVRDPTGPGSSTDPQMSRFFPLPEQAKSGTFRELEIPAAVAPAEGGEPVPMVGDDGRLMISYWNQNEQGQSVMFQVADGPVLLVRVTGFLSNYLRSIVLGLFQLAFLAALGCAVGAAFSTPVAAFVAVTYLTIGMLVQGAVGAPIKDELGDYQYDSHFDRALHYIAIGVSKIVVSVDDFDASSDLARGRLIELSRMAYAFFGLVGLRGALLGGLGMWVLTKRELGTVIRK